MFQHDNVHYVSIESHLNQHHTDGVSDRQLTDRKDNSFFQYNPLYNSIVSDHNPHHINGMNDRHYSQMRSKIKSSSIVFN